MFSAFLLCMVYCSLLPSLEELLRAVFGNPLRAQRLLFGPNAKYEIPGMNMGTVLVAMGGYGAYLGWSIRQNNQIAEELAPGPAWANREFPSCWFLFFEQTRSALRSMEYFHGKKSGAGDTVMLWRVCRVAC